MHGRKTQRDELGLRARAGLTENAVQVATDIAERNSNLAAISAGPSPATSSTTMSVSRGVSPKARHNPDMPAGPSCPWEAGAKAQLRRPDRRQRLYAFISDALPQASGVTRG